MLKLPRKAMRAFFEGWYQSGDEQSRNRKHHLLFNYAVNSEAALIGGNFLTGLLLYLRAGDAYIGLISILTFSGTLFQIISPLLLERVKRRKALIISLRACMHALNIAAIGIIPLLPANQSTRLTLITVLVFMVSLLNAAASSGITVWHLQFVPIRIRPRYWSILNASVGLLVVAVTLLASGVADHFKVAGLELDGLLILRGIALCLAAGDLFLLSRMKEYPYEQETWRLRDLLIRPLRERKYLLTVALACVWSFTANITGSYYSVYLLRDLHVTYEFITLISVLNIPVLLFLTPFWRKRVERHSWFKVMGWALGLYALYMAALAFVTGATVYVLYPLAILYAYVMGLGINLSFLNVPYINIPLKNQTTFISFYATANNLAAVLGAVAGQSFITATEGKALHLIGAELNNKQLLVLFVAGLMVVGAGVILALQKYTESNRQGEKL